MALASNPYGFQPSRHRNGGEIRLSSGYAIASGYASNIFAGDLVKSTGSSILGVPTIQLAVAGDTILGVFGGFANPITLTTGALQMPKFWAASTATLSGTVNQAMVYDDPDIIFNAMVSTTGTGTPDLSGAWNLNVGAGGNAVTGISGEFADTTGSPSQFRFYGIPKAPYLNTTGGYDIGGLGVFMPVELVCAKHEMAGVAAATFV
jgi:hypothetical protein